MPAYGLVAGALALVCAVLPAVATAAPINDDRANPIVLQLGVANAISNADATIATAEGLTTNDPAGQRCSNTAGVSTTQGVRMDRTLWWEFEGTGGPVTVSSDESNINLDTVLAVYEKAGDRLIGCNDDLQWYDPGRPVLPGVRVQSEMLIDTVAGRRYLAQLGGCTAPTPPLICNSPTAGDIKIRVSEPPANDSRAGATQITAGTPITATNTGATLEPGEMGMCETSPYAKTIWFRFRAPAIGQATFSVAGDQGTINTVMSVYRGDQSTPLACNDDAVQNTYGGSSIPPGQPAGAPVDVTPGDYLIQAGGHHAPGFNGVAAFHGPLTVQVGFAEDTDIDNDGYHRDVDCNDNDSSVHPGAPEILNNTIDEDCDGQLSYDRDGDGILASSLGGDCNDTNPAIRPGIPDIPDNRIDDNCDGADATTPTPRIDANYLFVKKRTRLGLTRIKVLRVTAGKGSRLPAGSTIELRCHGRQCDKRRTPQRRRIKHTQREVSVLTQLGRSLGTPAKRSDLRSGTRIEIRATKPGYIGYRVTIGIRSGKRPPVIRESCLTLIGKPKAKC
ncbi:MAG: putative metal-binding motif-containing protein [Solirubrobacteraceae bacterium]